jgi:ASC-1-like (ASCH) protein
MDHIAIMNKSWKLIDKILSGEKKIESRWYHSRFAPWNKIKKGETVYFKDAGCPVTAKATVAKVLQYADCTEEQVKKIIDEYGGSGGIAFRNKDSAFKWAGKKRYCTLVFLRDASKVTPFEIDKTGFGNACAWMCVDSIDKVKYIKE